MKVCWLTSVAAPYTLRLFEEIGRTVKLCVVMDDKQEANRNEEWKLDESDTFRIYRIDKDYRKKIKELAAEYDILVDGLYLSIYGYLAVNAFRKQGKKIVMTADGGIARNRGFLINGIMSYLMRRHDHFLSSSEITDRYFLYYGVDQAKIYHYRFTSLTKKDIMANRQLAQDKTGLRSKLQLGDKYLMISVGQPIRRKGFDILVQAYKESGLADKISLYIIGGKAQDNVGQYVRDNELNDVHFIDLLTSKELNEYYGAADLFILCTREDIWGLVVEEAMSFGLGVITSDECVAGLHFARLCDQVVICPSEDVGAFAEKIREAYDKQQDRQAILDCIKDYTIENSSKDIIKVLGLL